VSVYKPKYRDRESKDLRESPFWWIDFTIGNKRVRESSETTRKTIAIEYEKRRRLEMERALAGLPSEAPERRIRTVSEFVKTYLGYYPINHRPKSVVFATQRLANVKRLLGSIMLPDLTEDRIREYIKARLAEPKTSGRTINMELGELSRALGHKWSIIWPKVRKLEENHDAGQALSPEAEKRLLTAAAGDGSPNRNPMLYPFLCIALSTGMRSGEIAKLRWSSINLADPMLTVGRAKTRAGAGRQIPINADVKLVLENHIRWFERKLGSIRPDWHVFPGRAGKPRSGEQRPLDPLRPISDITTAWDALREKTGVSCRFHDLRHTAATKMAEAGVPESTMLAIMGHMSRAMLERYSHIRLAAKREAVKSLELPKLGPGLVSISTSKQRQSQSNSENSIAVSA
jgi:integrase